ncbi:S-adenosyl-L-methionine-dependent methyltransferase [Lentinula guzmanii]|uniref:type I protein arginine methyltransferase n=1 Tax=Lentinula guzmanii TaxID=2804957 RepID=A0AA38N3H7_9AGAR|nr:S-adenosyl-L-methionine-dependent methyltransferase [Lentinula guzmanii]
MSIHFHPTIPIIEDNHDANSSSSDEDEEEGENWDDWISDSAIQHGNCRSLFDDKVGSVEDILAYDKVTYDFDINEVCTKLSLDVHGRIRLINFIRQTKPSPANILLLTGKESFFSSDDFLRPVLEDDPLLQYEPGDWTDSEDEGSLPTERRIRSLEQKLAQTQRDFEEYRKIVNHHFSLGQIAESAPEEPSNSVSSQPKRDDDSHYFESYGANDIHAVMIQDKVRTSTYARFILSTPSVFEDAIVLDVGCGTGILSLFAARAGAKKVFAVDASNIATKAEKIVKANNLDNVITVIRGKVEDIQLPEGTKVDVIISEWMGYALLYESMLDSVLVARDRFLKPNGIMAPCQTRMMLGLCDASEIVKERILFWNDIYGYDMSAMAEELYQEAVIDVVGSHTMLSAPCIVKDLYLSSVTTRQLDFTSQFRLISSVDRRTKVTAFILYFDTFFTASGNPVAPETEVQIIHENEAVIAEVWPLGGRPAPQRRMSHQHKKGKSLEGGEVAKAEVVTSFSTGPKSIPTHWKQTLFLLKEPFMVDEGFVVHGHFHCRKSDSNSRELDVEVHYTVQDVGNQDESQDVVVAMFKIQ